MHLLENTPEASQARENVRRLLGDDHHNHYRFFVKGRADLSSVHLAIELWQSGEIPPEDWLTLCVTSGAYMQVFARRYSDVDSGHMHLPSFIWVDLFKIHLPKDVYDFFVSYWMENVQEAAHTLQKLSKRYPKAFGADLLFDFFKTNKQYPAFKVMSRIILSFLFKNPAYKQNLLDSLVNERNAYHHYDKGFFIVPATKNVYFHGALLLHIPKTLKNYEHIYALDISNTSIKTCPDFVLKMPDLVVFNFIGTKLMYNLDFLKALAEHKPLIYAGYAISWTYGRIEGVRPPLPVPLDDILKILYPNAVEICEEIDFIDPTNDQDLVKRVLKWTNVFRTWRELPSGKKAEYPQICELYDLFDIYQITWEGLFDEQEHYFYGG